MGLRTQPARSGRGTSSGPYLPVSIRTCYILDCMRQEPQPRAPRAVLCACSAPTQHSDDSASLSVKIDELVWKFMQVMMVDQELKHARPQRELPYSQVG